MGSGRKLLKGIARVAIGVGVLAGYLAAALLIATCLAYVAPVALAIVGGLFAPLLVAGIAAEFKFGDKDKSSKNDYTPYSPQYSGPQTYSLPKTGTAGNGYFNTSKTTYSPYKQPASPTSDWQQAAAKKEAEEVAFNKARYEQGQLPKGPSVSQPFDWRKGH